MGKTVRIPLIVVEKDCTGCKLCAQNCPTGSMIMVAKKAHIQEGCVDCKVCIKLCKPACIVKTDGPDPSALKCTHCPIYCTVPEGFAGACRRYINSDGRILRNAALSFNRPESIRIDPIGGLPDKPLLLGTGAGTNLSCMEPAAITTSHKIDGVEVVSAVTEAALSFSGVKVKVDTDVKIGDEGSPVKREGWTIGHVTTGEYGSRMLSIGGAEILTSKSGFAAVRSMIELANGKEVPLKIKGGKDLELKLGAPPLIDGQVMEKMRFGCGAAIVEMFGPWWKKVVDEVIGVDFEITALFSEHAGGKWVGAEYSGVIPAGRKSTEGRYFGEPGDGWGGSNITDPRQAIAGVDPKIAKPGTRIAVVETTGKRSALFVLDEGLEPRPVPITPAITEVVELIHNSSEPSLTSVLFVGGAGGGVRGSLSWDFLKVNRAIHGGKIKLTCAGVETYLLPGGGITFMVDAGKMPRGSFYWVPTPASVVPIEFTMRRETFEEIGGHVKSIIPYEELLSAGEYAMTRNR